MEGTAVATRFDPAQATATADAAVQRRLDEIEEQIAQEAREARDAGRKYAEHLAAGGDPSRPPDSAGVYRGRSALVTDVLALLAVYRVWNEARGSRNPIAPIRTEKSWRIAEALFERFGEPIPFAELGGIGTTGSFKASSSEVNDVLRTIADDTKAEIIPRKTKVDGKVAYLIRDRRDDDPDYWDDNGRWRIKGEGDYPLVHSRDVPDER